MNPSFALLKYNLYLCGDFKELMTGRTQKGNPWFYSGYMSAVERFFLNSGSFYLIIYNALVIFTSAFFLRDSFTIQDSIIHQNNFQSNVKERY